MKRYLVFAYDHFPDGGMKDFISCHDDEEAAMKMCRIMIESDQNTFSDGHIWDCDLAQIVWEE